MEHSFLKKLDLNTKKTNSHLCIGLDPDPKKMPTKFPESLDGVERFLTEVISETQDLCIAYKPNISFFEALGIEGLRLLERIMKKIPTHTPTILDAKRGDIGNTSAKQAKYLFDVFGADASTLNPLMGDDCVEPFLAYKEKFHFILALTSNPGAKRFEKLKLESGKYVYQEILDTCLEWDKTYKNIGCVIGATRDEMNAVRKQAQHLPFLVPGVGAQGGDYKETSAASVNSAGITLINVSRGVLYVSKENNYLETIRKTISTNYQNKV